jgi:nicotinamide-nucleotide amidase
LTGAGLPGTGLTGAGLPGTGLTGAGRAGPAEPAGAELAARIVGLLTQRQQTVAVAESLTGGLLGAAITTVPGASVVFRGGVIAYATDLKAALLGVPAALLAERGAVDPDVAGAMAGGVAQRLGATAGVATTGVAGPDPAEGKPPGTVHIAVCAGGGAVIQTLALSGSRDEIRRDTVERSLRLLWSVLGEESL